MKLLTRLLLLRDLFEPILLKSSSVFSPSSGGLGENSEPAVHAPSGEKDASASFCLGSGWLLRSLGVT